MLSLLLTDMCLDTINSTTKFSPVISRCNFAGVNGMSLHLQTEKLKSITLSWQLSAARLRRSPLLLRPPGGSGSAGAEPGPRPQVWACCHSPDPAPPPRPATAPPPSQDPPAGGQRRRGSSAVIGPTRPRGRPDPAASPGWRPQQPPLAVSPTQSPGLPEAAARLPPRPPPRSFTLPLPPPAPTPRTRAEDTAGPRGGDGRERDGNLLGVGGIPIYGF